MTPVIRNADKLSVPDLARAIYDLATRARAGKLSPDEMTGATYTISNSGSYGTLFTASIINQPQVAILSTDGVKKKPVVIEVNGKDEIAIRPIGVLAQSFDHRAFDGAYSAAFLKRLKEEIEGRDWTRELE
jgi:VCBS repeat-containing protein